MQKKLILHLGDSSQVKLEFQIEQNPIAELWLKMMHYRNKWPLDDPTRFYAFGSQAEEEERAYQMITKCITTVNQHRHIIDREFTSIKDQEHLNYLHNIFETYHGRIDQQTSDFWETAPPVVRTALGDLNHAVHRCENLLRPLEPTITMTWYGMPKLHKLSFELLETFGTCRHEFGGVYLLMADVGKSALAMAIDNDDYINKDEMFFYMNHYSADFKVTFFTDTDEHLASQQQILSNYFEKNKEFFHSKGIVTVNDVRVQPIQLKLAQLIYDPAEKDRIMSLIKNNQYVSSVTII